MERPRWAGIVRVSFVGTRGGDTLHADQDQVEQVERYARLHGADVEFLPPEMSVSGGRPISERPSLKAAIEGVEAGRYDGVVVAYLSRLSRSRSGIEIWERVEAAGGRVHCAQENLDTSTANGRWIRDMHLANAVREREEHAERHAERRRKTVDAGIWRVRQLPIGYAFAGPSDENGDYRGRARRLVPGSDADLVRDAFAARVAGTSIVTIAAKLKMTTSGVRAVLRNRVYVGELHDGEHVNLTAHQALIDEDVFMAVQSARVTRNPRTMPTTALLAGLVRCSGCMHVMSPGVGKVPSYSCHVNHSDGRCPAPAAITLRLLDEHVAAIAARELVVLRDRPGASEHRIHEARAARTMAEGELSAYIQAVSASDVGAEAYGAGARQRRAAAQAALSELENALAEHAATPVPTDAIRDWPRMDSRQRNHLLRGLFEVVLVQRAGGRGHQAPITDRVRVVRHGAGLSPSQYRGGSEPLPLRRVEFDELDDMYVARA